MIKKNILTKLQPAQYLESIPYLKEAKAQAFLTLVLTLIAISFFGLFAISPTVSTIVQLKKQVEDSIYVDQKLEEKINNLSLLQGQYTRLETQLPIVFSAVPQRPNAPSLTAQVNGVAAASQVTITRFQTFQVQLTKIKTMQNKYASFSFTLEAKGSYANLATFLTNIVNFQRLVTVNGIAFNNQSGVNESPTMTIDATAYFKQ